MTTRYLNIKIKGIRNIDEADLTLPFMNGIYTFVGANGSGKSTILQCLAQLVVPKKDSRVWLCMMSGKALR